MRQVPVDLLVVHYGSETTLIDISEVENFRYKIEEGVNGEVPAGVGRYNRHTISWTEPAIETPYAKETSGQSEI